MLGYIAGGAAIGALSGGLAEGIIGSGMAFNQTVATIGASSVNSIGMNALSGGQTGLSVSIGVASYDISKNKVGYLGKEGNSFLENLGYGLGAFANISDAYGAIMGANESVDLVSSGHSKLMKNGDFLFDYGTDINGWRDILGDGKQLGDAFKKGTSTNKYFMTGKEANLTDELIATGRHQTINGVNLTKLSMFKVFTEGRNNYCLTRVLPFGGRNCSIAASIALLKSGVLNIPFDVPGFLSFQMYIRQYSPTIFALLR